MTGTTSNTQERFTLPRGAQQTSLLLALLLQQGLTNPEYLRVLNKSYPTKRKDSKGMLAERKD